MKDMLTRITRRIKKNIIWIIALPVVLGAAGYVLPSKISGNSSFTSEAAIAAGNYDHPLYNNTKEIPFLLTSDAFLKQALPDKTDEERAAVKSKLTVETQSDSLITVSYSGQNKQETESVFQAVITTFLKNDQDLFEKRAKVVRQSIAALEGETVSADAKVDKERFLYELKNMQLNLKAAGVINSEPMNETAGQGMPPKKKAVLGVLIGIAVAFMFIVIPEFFRESL
ncbi:MULTISPECIES: teichuronic acid biosynthesis protein TuaF [Bacillus amyloliquefaciens group]|uniref:teichuronic acid biosynthesis protein TuaF n=1 Tax=Bacillus amyloliquefaciens group TaxID=1938374 RepID=UPI00168AAC93|nr:hypothetical protein [Bacillus velezensis]QOC79309.1 hypothetical protein ID168_16540 [Bacillus velezensis]QYM56245.1 hypothetical protein KNV92_16570 [Bacillus velezensis]WKD94239.1 hypothetical protein QY487_16610 [Bacillus velezensis]